MQNLSVTTAPSPRSLTLRLASRWTRLPMGLSCLGVTALLTVDTESGEVVEDTKEDGFLRLNNAGDGRHVMVSDGGRFRVFNTGLEARAHGDHFHYHESAPALTDRAF